MPLLLLFCPEHQNAGPDIADGLHNRPYGRSVIAHLLMVDELQGGGGFHAPVLPGPSRRHPALLSELINEGAAKPPGLLILLKEHTLPIRGNRLLKPGPKLLSEGLFFWREPEVHRCACLSIPAAAPAHAWRSRRPAPGRGPVWARPGRRGGAVGRP